MSKLKIPALILVATLCAIFLTGAGGRDTGAGRAGNTDYLNTDSAMPIVREKITLQLVMPKGPTNGPADRIWFWKWAEREMNIKFDITQIDTTGMRERVNLMMASNELPEVFFGDMGFSTRDIFQYGQKEKQFIPLNSLIQNHAVNLTKFFTESPTLKAQSTCPDGNIYFLPGFNFAPQTFQGVRPWIHKGWLDRLGLKMPANLDEFYDVLVAFRDRDPNGNGRKDEIPMTGGVDSMSSMSVIFFAALGFPEPDPLNPVVVNGEVRMLAASPVYGEYLRYMNRLFSEELLDNDYYTNTTVQIRAKGSELRVGVHTDGAPFQMTPNEADWRQYEVIPPMTSRWNNTRMWLNNPDILVGRFTVTNVCRHPEAAVRFGDYFFTEEAPMYSYYGPPRDHPDLMGNHNGWYFNNAGAIVYDRTGTNLTNDEDYRMAFISVRGANNFGLCDFQTPIEKLAGQKFVHAPNALAWRVSMETYIGPWIIPKFPFVYFDIDENDRVLELTSTIRDYMRMMDARFITGAEPLANIPAYLERVRNLGAGDLEKYYRDAYTVYLRNLR